MPSCYCHVNATEGYSSSIEDRPGSSSIHGTCAYTGLKLLRTEVESQKVHTICIQVVELEQHGCQSLTQIPRPCDPVYPARGGDGLLVGIAYCEESIPVVQSPPGGRV